MLFNSLQFLVFFGFVTSAFFALKHRWRWILLLLSSIYFYMAFVPVYVLILFATIVIDYIAGLVIEKNEGRKRYLWLVVSLVTNVGILAFFKYYNFINDNLTALLGIGEITNPIPALKILLPIGLSFHTFQAMSYTIEVYRGNQKAERHFGLYALYVMFYPQLVAGPIERPQNLVHQFKEEKTYDAARIRAGIMRMAWGFFKKVVIADRLALFVDECYGDILGHNGLTFCLAIIFYSFQIYCDFSGYSDIAIGAAQVMGFKLMENFEAPYLAKSLTEFWRRWHISLSTWFKDYVYFPLGGSRNGIYFHCRNLLIVFALSGLWHGANWTFVIWGLLHALYLIIESIKKRFAPKFVLPGFLAAAATFIIVSIFWIFFRAQNISDAFAVIQKLTKIRPMDGIETYMHTRELLFSFLLVVVLLIKEAFWRTINTDSRVRYYLLLALLIGLCYTFGIYNQKQFIYFQF